MDNDEIVWLLWDCISQGVGGIFEEAYALAERAGSIDDLIIGLREWLYEEYLYGRNESFWAIDWDEMDRPLSFVWSIVSHTDISTADLTALAENLIALLPEAHPLKNETRGKQ